MPGYRQLARNRDFTVLWLGDTVNELGTRMSIFAFPLLTWALTGSTLWAAVVEAVFLVGLSATLLPAGVLVDRLDRRHVMLSALALGGAAFASLTVAGLLHAITIPHLVAVAAVVGVTTGLYQPAQTSALRSVVATDDLPAALASNQARVQVAELLGGPIGGMLYAVTRWLPFGVNAITYVVSALAVLAIRTDLGPLPRAAKTRMRADLVEGLRFALSRPFFRVLLSWAALFNLVTNAIFFVVIMRLVQAGVAPAMIGAVSAATGLGGILGAVLAPAIIERTRTGWLAITASWMLTLPLVALIWSTHPLAVAACLFLLMVPNPAVNAGVGAYRMAITPHAMQGRVASAGGFLALSVMPLAPLLGGTLLDRYGGSAAIAGLVLASALLALLLTASRSIREVPRPRDWAAADGLPAPVPAA